MTCERYWRDGILLVERGLTDPHRTSCADCTRAHAARAELVDALPLISDGHTGDPAWQAAVWRRIDGVPGRAPSPRRWHWQLAGGLAFALVLALWLGVGRDQSGVEQVADVRPWHKIIAQGPEKRSSPSSAHIGDVLQVTAGPRAEVWVFRDEQLVLRCRAGQALLGCTPDAVGLIAEVLLERRVTYQAFVVEAPAKPPPDGLDAAQASLVASDARYTVYVVPVR